MELSSQAAVVAANNNFNLAESLRSSAPRSTEEAQSVFVTRRGVSRALAPVVAELSFGQRRQ